MAENLEQRLNRLTLEIAGSPPDQGESQGVKAHPYLSIHRHKNSITHISLGLKGGCYPQALLRKESGIDRLGKQLGINREFLSGDAEFDTAVYMETNLSDEDLQALLANSTFRTAAMLILKAGAKKFELHKEGLRLTLAGKSMKELDSKACTEYLGALRLSQQGLPRYSAQTLPVSRKSPGLGLLISAGIFCVLGIIGFAVSAGVWEPLDGAPFGWGALGGLTAFIMCLPFAGRKLRGYSDSFRKLIILACILLAAWPLAGMGVVLGSNGILDNSPPVSHNMPVINQYITRNKNSKTYHLQVKSWRPGEAYIHLKVHYSFYDSHPPGTSVIVITRAGYWNWEWLDGHQ